MKFQPSINIKAQPALRKEALCYQKPVHEDIVNQAITGLNVGLERSGVDPFRQCMIVHVGSG